VIAKERATCSLIVRSKGFFPYSEGFAMQNLGTGIISLARKNEDLAVDLDGLESVEYIYGVRGKVHLSMSL